MGVERDPRCFNYSDLTETVVCDSISVTPLLYHLLLAPIHYCMPSVIKKLIDSVSLTRVKTTRVEVEMVWGRENDLHVHIH